MKLNKKYLAPICSLFVTGGLLITIAVLTLGSSFGWFSNNDKVSASGISVSSVSPYNTDQQLCVLEDGTLTPLGEDADPVLLSDLTPDATKTVYVRIQNNEDSPLNLELLLAAPTLIGEYVSETTTSGNTTVTNYYYFGSQIRISDIRTCNVSGTASGNDLRIVHGKDAFLLTMPDSFYSGDVTKDTVTQGVGVTSPYQGTPSQKKLTGAITVPAATKDADTGDVTPGVIYLAIDFQFAENGQEQNPYIGFGTGSSRGALSRQLLCWYTEGN